VSLAQNFVRDKTDLFRAWLMNDEDWTKSLYCAFGYFYFTTNIVCILATFAA
jgi:hypothetical protein